MISPAALSPAAPPTPGSDRAKLAAASRQFEAIFVRQMLAAARKADFGEPLLGGSQNGGGLDTFRQMQDDRFADLAAQSGTFGLARQIETALVRQIGARQIGVRQIGVRQMKVER